LARVKATLMAIIPPPKIKTARTTKTIAFLRNGDVSSGGNASINSVC